MVLPEGISLLNGINLIYVIFFVIFLIKSIAYCNIKVKLSIELSFSIEIERYHLEAGYLKK